MSCAERPDDFEQGRTRLRDLSDEALQARFWELLERIGFEAEPFGGDAMVLHAVPNPHPRFDAKRCFEEMVAEIGTTPTRRGNGWGS